MTRRILEKLQLDRIAAVDRPCQEHAVVTILKREFSDKERKKLADKGHAMPDGSYPIKSTTDLKHAIQAIGRSPHYHAVRRHIIQRAKDLGVESQLPEHWTSKRSLTLADLITKDLIMLPMAMPDDDEGAESFSEALQDIMECQAEDDIYDALHPYQHALKDSIVSVMLDKTLDSPTRVMMVRNVVEDYLSAVQNNWPQYFQQIEQNVATKRKLELFKRSLMCRVQLAKLSFMSKWNLRGAKQAQRKHLKLASGGGSKQKTLHRQAATHFKTAVGHFQSGNHSAGRRSFALGTRMAARAHAGS